MAQRRRRRARRARPVRRPHSRIAGGHLRRIVHFDGTARRSCPGRRREPAPGPRTHTRRSGDHEPHRDALRRADCRPSARAIIAEDGSARCVAPVEHRSRSGCVRTAPQRHPQWRGDRHPHRRTPSRRLAGATPVDRRRTNKRREADRLRARRRSWDAGSGIAGVICHPSDLHTDHDRQSGVHRRCRPLVDQRRSGRHARVRPRDHLVGQDGNPGRSQLDRRCRAFVVQQQTRQ